MSPVPLPATLFTRREAASNDIERRGLLIDSAEGTTKIQVRSTTRLQALEDRELVLFAVKSFDTGSISQAIKPHLSPGVVLATVQNGLGNIEVIKHELPRYKLIGGTTTLGAMSLGNGRVKRTALGETIIGELRKPPSQPTKMLAKILSSAGIPTRVTGNLRRTVWRKALINVGINPVTAILRLTNGELTQDRDALRIASLSVSEGVRVARAEGIRLLGDVVKEMREVALETSENRSSMLEDVENNRRTEIDALNGSIVRMGRIHSIPTPVNAALWRSVKSLEPKEEHAQRIAVAA